MLPRSIACPEMSDRTKTISHGTPMTLALAIFFGGLLYYAGVATADYRHSVDKVRANQQRLENDTRAWRNEITRLLQEMTAVARDNKRRLDLIDSQ